MAGLQGKLLISTPKLSDPNFARTILLLVQHGDEGAMGLVLNRPSDTTLGGAWEEISEGECENDGVIYQGGPCEGPLMLLHTHEPASQIDIGDGLHLSSEQDHVKWLVEHDGGPIKAFVGYAGWSPGQLEAEIAEGAWIVAQAEAGNVITEDPDWDQLIRQLLPGLIEVKIVPEDPSLN